MAIKLEQVIEAIETADDAFTYLYDTQTGETILLPDDVMFGERDETLEELIENAPTGRFLQFLQNTIFMSTASWRTLYIRYLLARLVRSLSTRSAAEARSGDSKTGFVIIVWSNNGTTTGIRLIGRLPYTGARTRGLNIQKKPERGAAALKKCSRTPF